MADAPDHRHAGMPRRADGHHRFLARARAFGAKPRLRREHEAGRKLPSHEARHKRERTLALFRFVRIELCKDEEIALWTSDALARVNAPALSNTPAAVSFTGTNPGRRNEIALRQFNVSTVAPIYGAGGGLCETIQLTPNQMMPC
jgi:hypothetical protein